MWRSSCVIFLILHLAVDVRGIGLIEVFGWKQMDYENRGGVFAEDFVFPTKESGLAPRFGARPPTGAQSESYIPYNNVPMGVNHYKGKLFITMPRRRLGIPSTLNYIDLKAAGSNLSPKLRAFPDLETNTLPPNLTRNVNRIISVYRTRIDACNRLWFIDTGLLELPDNRTQVQRPSIWIFDLATNRRLHRFEIPESIVQTGPGLASITVDADKTACDQAFGYIPDLVNNALYVYSLGQNRMWSFRHNFFHFDPTQGDLSIGGQNFSWDDGIFSITLGNKQPDGFRTAYFHPMASSNEFAVSTQVLQTESNAARSNHGRDFRQQLRLIQKQKTNLNLDRKATSNGFDFHVEVIELLGTRGQDKQSTMHDFDPKTGIIFYAEIMENGVGCWNSKKTEFSALNHGQVAMNPSTMIYPSDLTIDNESNIWVMTNSMPIFIYSQLDPNVVNFRVWRQTVRAAAENTVCAI